jgi:hypothetical protein
MVQRTERTVGRVQRDAPSICGLMFGAIRFLGSSTSTATNGPSAHEPVIRTNDPAPLRALAAAPDHRSVQVKTEALSTAAGAPGDAAAGGSPATSKAPLAATSAAACRVRIALELTPSDRSVQPR